MCGIAGWIGRQGDCGRDVLERMNRAIAHRGPDGNGYFSAGTRDNRYDVQLTHRRLAIIDLATGEQPMRSPDGRITLIFNGEIYNFKALREELRGLGHGFVTASDTEVLLEAYRAWGPDCVTRLRGMFAFALWDAAKEELVLARDHFGKKPMFLWQKDGLLVFGSEIKALLAHPAVTSGLDRQSVLDFLQYRYVPGPNTLFAGITKLEPGSYAVWREGELARHVYYRPPDGKPRPDAPAPGDAEAIAAFSGKLDECVQLRLESDVPFGAFLSGGLDSSAIVALMTRHMAQPVNTFCVGFAEAEYSEMPYARMVAEKFHTDHHELTIKSADIMEYLPRVIGYHDAPMSEPTDVAIYLLARDAAKSVKMVLTGEGSDEILGGYPKHNFEPFAQIYQTLVPPALQENLVTPLLHRLPYRFHRTQTLLDSFGVRDARERMPRWFGALTLAERGELATLDAPQRPANTAVFAEDAGSALRRILYFDQTSWLPDNLLERGDRMTMAAGLEARMPFMDRELAALVSSYPDRFRVRGGTQKWLLRRAMRDILPPEILGRRKVGFRVPVNLWFRTTLKDFVREHLLGPKSLTRDFYDREVLTNILTAHADGRRNHEKLIWALLNLELFQQQYRLT